jgi:hypothetical protein
MKSLKLSTTSPNTYVSLRWRHQVYCKVWWRITAHSWYFTRCCRWCDRVLFLIEKFKCIHYFRSCLERHTHQDLMTGEHNLEIGDNYIYHGLTLNRTITHIFSQKAPENNWVNIRLLRKDIRTPMFFRIFPMSIIELCYAISYR